MKKKVTVYVHKHLVLGLILEVPRIVVGSIIEGVG